ncbi:MAG: trigger factor [Pyrinomonadaceae bacterium]|jgi:trigger factor|nr:trigger factor [Pyrinomonadaceae bacterium]
MNTELVDVSPTRKEIKIEIEPATIRAAYDRVSDQYAKQAKVPGFRPGHAPRAVVRTRFKNEIRAQALQELVPDAVNEAITKHELKALGEPDVQLANPAGLDKFGDEPLAVNVSVEVLPEVELQTYKGLAATRKTRPVTDDDVAKMIEALRESAGAMQPVEDRGATLGDTVTVNVAGKFLDDPPEEDFNAEDIEVVLGGPGVQPEFTENLTGVKPDDEKTFTVAYPEDSPSKGLAGRKLEYTANVSAVRVKELPELDDEWARSLDENFDSVATLREKIRENMELQARQESDHHLRGDLLQKLVAGHPFEVPQSMIEHQINYRLESVVRDMMSRGVDPRQQNVDWESARASLTPQAEQDVRGSLLLDRIAEEEKIAVSSEEIEADILAIARDSQQSLEQVRSVLTKDGGERSIANRLRNRKALDLIAANAQVTDEEWRAENDSEGNQESGVSSQESE